PLPARPLSWDALLAPLGVGRAAALDYALGPLRRGAEHDVILPLRSIERGSSVEVHILDRGRWTGVRETPSFGVAYEAPRSEAAAADCEAVTEAIAQALRHNDPG